MHLGLKKVLGITSCRMFAESFLSLVPGALLMKTSIGRRLSWAGGAVKLSAVA